MDRIKRLHVDKAPEEDEINRQTECQMNLLLQRIAMVSGEHAPDGDVAEVVTEVMEWLETQGDDVTVVSLSNDRIRRALFSFGTAWSTSMYPMMLIRNSESGPTCVSRFPPKIQSCTRKA